MRRTKSFCCLFVILCIVLFCACAKEEGIPLTEVTEQEMLEGDQPESEAPAKIVVYICGEVRRPGIYELSPDSRVYQVLEAAGGMTEVAADTYLNQAEVIMDGQSIYVPSQEEVDQIAVPEAPIGSSGDGGKVNINKAGKEELMTLTGIGEAKATSIIEYREANGRFNSVEEIMNIPGIKEGVFEKIKAQISVS